MARFEASSGETVAEVSRQQAAQKLFDLLNAKKGTDNQTVENYFILEFPFDLLKQGDKRIPAGVVGRQSSWRGERIVVPPRTITDPQGGKQGTIFGSLIDFGGVLVVDPRLRSRFDHPRGLIYFERVNRDAELSLAWKAADKAAAAFRGGRPKAVYEHLDTMLEPIEAKWRRLDVAKNLQMFSGPLSSEQVQAMEGRPAWSLDSFPRPRWREILMGLISTPAKISVDSVPDRLLEDFMEASPLANSQVKAAVKLLSVHMTLEDQIELSKRWAQSPNYRARWFSTFFSLSDPDATENKMNVLVSIMESEAFEKEKFFSTYAREVFDQDLLNRRYESLITKELVRYQISHLPRNGKMLPWFLDLLRSRVISDEVKKEIRESDIFLSVVLVQSENYRSPWDIDRFIQEASSNSRVALKLLERGSDGKLAGKEFLNRIAPSSDPEVQDRVVQILNSTDISASHRYMVADIYQKLDFPMPELKQALARYSTHESVKPGLGSGECPGSLKQLLDSFGND